MAQDQVLQIFSNDKMRWQTAVLTVPTVGEQTPEESRVVLHHIGDNFYFDKIWIEGKTYGYEFPLPEKAKALQRELALEVPAKYQPAQSTGTQASSAQAVQPNPQQDVERAGSQAQADSAQDRERQAALEQERRTAAEREQQAQSDRERIASIQRDQSVTPPATPAPSSRARPDTQSNAQSPAQLPATASNWAGFLVGGMFLLTVSALLRPTTRRQKQEK